MRFGGVLALLSFAYVVLSGLVQGADFGVLVQHAIVVLILYFVFGAAVGQIGEAVVVEDLDQADAAVRADLARIQQETEELSGISRFRDQSVPVMTQELEPGAVLAEDARTPAGEILFRTGTAIDDAAIRRMIEEGVRKVRVQRS